MRKERPFPFIRDVKVEGIDNDSPNPERMEMAVAVGKCPEQSVSALCNPIEMRTRVF